MNRHYDSPPPRRRRRRRRFRGLKIFLTVILIVLLVGFAGYKLLVVPPDVGSGAGLAASNPFARLLGLQSSDDEGEDEDEYEASDAGLLSADKNRRPGTYTFVVIATDQESYNTDVMMVGTLDTENHSLDMVSIPRDTLVNVPWGTKKVNSLYASAGGDHDDGIQAIKDGLRDILGYTVDHYVAVDMDGFVALVDAMGGVEFDVPIDMEYEDFVQDLLISIPAGPQLLDGETALKVVRFRSGYVNADLGRIDTQQAFLKEVAKQLINDVSITNISSYAKIFNQYVDTSYSIPNLIWLGLEFLKLSDDEINFHVMPGDASVRINRVWYVSIYLEQWLETLNDTLSPYNDRVTIGREHLNVLMSDSGGIHSTTGVIEGGANSFSSAPY